MKVEVGQVAVVTGAASGIGLGLATRFAELGVDLVLADIDADALERVRAALAGKNVSVIAQAADVANASQMTHLRDTALERFGRVDILCNNAGIVTPFRPLWENPVEDWERVLAINLWGVIHGLRLFVPAMVERGRGHVVNVASMAGLIVVPSNGIYNASKHAVVSLSETLHADLEAARSPVGVTVVCPGMVTSNINNAPAVKASKPPLPAGAVFLEPSEIARQTVLAIEDNRLYLATHPGSSTPIERRVERLLRDTADPL